MNKSKIFIGEQAELVLEFKYPKNKGNINYIPFQQTIPLKNKIEDTSSAALEIIQAFKDTVIHQGKYDIWQGKYRVTGWDSGYFVLPETSLKYLDSTYFFKPLLISINFPKIIQNKDLYDIKEQFIPIDYDLTYWLKKYAWIILVLVLIGLVLYLFKRKRKANTTSIATKNELEIIQTELEELKAKKLGLKGEYKTHYSSLSYLLRRYLTYQFNLNLLEKTSEETALLLKDKVTDYQLSLIKNLLNYSDLIKFAKALPGDDSLSIKHVDEVLELINEIHSKSVQNV